MPAAYQEFLVAYQEKNWTAATRLGEELLAVGFTERRSDDRGLITAYLATAYRNLGNLSRAQALAFTGRTQVKRGTRAEAYTLVEGVTIHAMRGAFTEAIGWAEEYISRKGDWAAPESARWLGVVHYNLAYVYRMLMNDTKALEHCRASASAYRQSGDTPMSRYLQVVQAQVLCDMGDLVAADEVLGQVAESDVPPDHVVDLLVVRATHSYLSGSLPEALTLANRALARTQSLSPVRFLDAITKALIGHILKKMGHTVEGELFIRTAVEKCHRNGRTDLLAQIAKLGGEGTC